ncbi:MAG: glycosyltransferase family 4 protein, partial [Candidatus Omnitrophica bacterium]|nr:glycosyltransferase family 4 protein [Candidatus Omnitrophota bacterium]
EAFRRLAVRRRFVLRIIGGGRSLRLPGVPLEERAWSFERELEEFQRCDIGIYPLLDDEWSKGKCGFKALQFMACGVPVVASRVGMNCELISHGANGFLASSIPEWAAALEALLDDQAMRRRLGEAGRATVESRYSLTVNAPTFVRAVHQLWDSSR